MLWSAIFQVVALTIGIPGGPRVSADLRAYAVDRAASQLYVVTHKTGMLSFFGHEHAIIPRAWTAVLCLANPVPMGAHGSVVLETGSLLVDSDSARALARLGSGEGEDDRRRIQQKMLDPAHLDAARFPNIRIDVVALEAATAGGVRTRMTVSLHGVSRVMDLPVRIESGAGGGMTLSGVLRIRQRDFGIEPESIGGVVKVSNDVDLHFRLVAVPTGNRCAE